MDDLSMAVHKAIQYCIDHDHLRDFLILNQAEVAAMSLLEGSWEEYADSMDQELERLKESDAFDLIWSDKVGYVLLDISTNYDYVDSARRIETAEELCRLMLEDIALDVLLLTENEHSIETADPLERAEIVRRWQPYFEQLPEYEYLREELTSEWP